MTGCIYDPIFLEHGLPWHPENRKRLEAIVARLQASGLWDSLQHLDFGPADQADVATLHTDGYVEYLFELCRDGGGDLDSDTPATRETFPAAVMAVGGCLQACEAIAAGAVANAICLVRPPGHHALAHKGMGFCFFNNAALAAEHLLRAGLERVAIVDWDVHHGNGIQDLFYHRRDVLYVSVHESTLFPGTGSYEEVGVEDGAGFTMNIPLSGAIRDEHLLRAHEELIFPALRAYQPQFIIVAAGYDGHWRDPLAECELTTDVYHRIMADTVAAATELCGGRLCVMLEGGYDLSALALGVENTVLALQGKPLEEHDPSIPPANDIADAEVTRQLELLIAVHTHRLGL